MSQFNIDEIEKRTLAGLKISKSYGRKSGLSFQA